MAAISRIRPGQILYTVARQRAGNTTLFRTAVHQVHVKEVGPAGTSVVASWNGNVARKFNTAAVAKLRVANPNKPATAAMSMGVSA